MTKRFLSKVGKSLTRACAVTLPKVTEQVRAKVENGSNQNQHRRIRRHPVGSGYKFRIILQHRHIKMYRQRKTHHAVRLSLSNKIR
ncbi:hypothetical protein KC19_VG321600 [Ceratodon purpureus]|uniref:Uncharacterized protein n=1 Tax=Ceratodon purpureus TaxID=3225 RepID=A0A8T0HWU4_CERPU|nr:hypothetical protein KC19_VG321600 [Ceratodon purpureus]